MPASAWSDLASALVIALFGSAIAALWPWLVARQRRVRFQLLIRRELEETSPYPSEPDGRPWFHHLSKRFVHEEIFARERITENRDFILSLDPTVTYHVSQLWIAFEKGDLTQWRHHIQALSTNRHVGSERLKASALKWRQLVPPPGDSGSTAAVRVPRTMNPTPEPAPGLFEARRTAYVELLELTRAMPAGQPRTTPEAFTDWYYRNGNGLLLSGDALRGFLTARQRLGDASATPKDVDDAMTTLRTELKIDLGVRHPDERQVELARSIDRIGY